MSFYLINELQMLLGRTRRLHSYANRRRHFRKLCHLVRNSYLPPENTPSHRLMPRFIFISRHKTSAYIISVHMCKTKAKSKITRKHFIFHNKI